MKVGNLRRNIDVSVEFSRLAREDEAAAEVLAQACQYRQAVYFLVQAMEKHIRAKIFTLVNPTLQYFRERNRSHSVEDAVDFLIEIVSCNNTIRQQVKEQLCTHVLGDIRYNQLHNNVRYPIYSGTYNTYSMLDIGEQDYIMLSKRLSLLRVFLGEIHRFV